MAGAEKPAARSDLGVRTLSALVMVAVAGTALWLGGGLWLGFVGLVALGVLWEWWQLVRRIWPGVLARTGWMIFALVYLGFGCLALIALRNAAMEIVLALIALVIATDVGAYFAGRAIGGPKIAPRISPSKTWAGLGGGMLGAALVGAAAGYLAEMPDDLLGGDWPWFALGGAGLAVVAQAGDFFESWLKRRAGVKDSGRLIPGHGGLFDRVDGLLAVLFLAGIASLYLIVDLTG